MRRRTFLLGDDRRAYYVDATNGADTNTGRSPAQAWQTIAKVNGATLRAGDSVLFKRGETWSGTSLSGVSGVTYGAYGTGAKPALDGGWPGGTSSSGVNPFVATGKTGITLENLELRAGLDHGAKFDGCSRIVVGACDMHHVGNDALICINGTSDVAIVGGSYKNATRRIATYFATGIEITDGGANFLIDGVDLSGNQDAGITVHNHNATDPQGATNIPQNVTLRNIATHGNGIGINIMNQEATAACAMTIFGCTAYSNTQDGIRIAPSGAALTDLEYLSGVTISRCLCYDNTRYPIYVEADDVTLQQNLFADGDTHIVKSLRPRLINNTFYNGTRVAGAFYVEGARSASLYGRNNIVQCDVAGQVICAVTSGTGVTGWDMDYTLYRRTGGTTASTQWHWRGTNVDFATWKTNSGGDVHSIYGDALFTNVAANDFTLQVGSPAINAGVDVGLAFLGAAPDLGYAEAA